MKNTPVIETTSSRQLSLLGFKTQTDIQKHAIPILENGQSLLGLAPTGSGKTLAFLLPLMGRINVTRCETQLLILAPTRELGAQIAKVAQNAAQTFDQKTRNKLMIRTAFGGQKSKPQKIELLKKPHIIVATPGRALDFIKNGVLSLKRLIAFVLDEADLMLGMGFERQVKEICNYLPQKIQTALFSATELELASRLQNRLIHRAERVDVRSENSESQINIDTENNEKTISIPAQISHQFITVPTFSDRTNVLVQFISMTTDKIKNGLIFCQTRKGVTMLTQHLRKNSISAEELSGELGQIERLSILRRFKAGGIKYLIATNIAGRGIDIDSLSIVINYDLPSTAKEYTHRVGRSGRAGNFGWALSFCTQKNEAFFHDLLSKLNIQLEPFNLVDLTKVSKSLQKPKENSTQVCKFSKIHLNRGKADKLRPGDILGSLTKDIGLKREDVGNIFIFDHFTHVEVNSNYVEKVMISLAKTKIKNFKIKAKEANKLSRPNT